MLHNGSFVTDIREKCNIFNEFFRHQCTLVETTSTLPTLVKQTDLTLNEVNFTQKDISDIINKLDIKKAYGHDGISPRMLKIFGNTISKPLYIIYKNCINKGVFPNVCGKWPMLFQYIKKTRQI